MVVKLGEWGFKEIQLKDKKMYSEFIKVSQYPTNLFRSNFDFLWAISKSHGQKVLWKVVDGMLVTYCYKHNRFLQLSCLPFGKGDPEKVIKLSYKCLKNCQQINGRFGKKTMVREVNHLQLDFLKRSSKFDRIFTVRELKGIERHLGIQSILTLEGKKFSNVRNHINRFNKTYPNAIFRRYQPRDYSSLIKLKEHWNETLGQKYHKITDDLRYFAIIEHFEELGHMILVAEIDGRIVGMVSGGILPNGEAWSCFLKKMNLYSGLAEKLIIELAREINRINPKVELLNLGDDCGVQGGLSQFKKKFNPELNLRRYRLYI